MSLSMIATIIAAVIAAFLLLRLYMVLGRRTGTERSQSEPTVSTNLAAPTITSPQAGVAAPRRVPPPRPENFDPSEPMSLDGQISYIQQADPGFNERSFLQGARLAFEQIVTAFAKGEEANLKNAMSPALFASFRQALHERAAARNETGEHSVTEMRAIDQIEIIAASLEPALSQTAPATPSGQIQAAGKSFGRWGTGLLNKKRSPAEAENGLVKNGMTRPEPTAKSNRARLLVTVRFISAQIHYRVGRDGQLIEGDKVKPIEVVDVWTFAREAMSHDPNWLLVGTRGE
ncbi:MAG: Tim44/TimA family putative adaptor protein [Candidatus Symbiobacter sp.]|nr:Tim44/TimA family putative adaptor protein [Candidatus Symbiobacter sp.]